MNRLNRDTISPMTSPWPLVLTYHAIVPDRLPVDYTRLGLIGQSEFERQLRVIQKDYDVLHPDEFTALLEQGRTAPRRSALVTLDDGFQNVLEYAAPVAASLEISLLAFVSTAHLDGGEWLWFSRWRANLLAGASGGEATRPPTGCGSQREIEDWLARIAAPRRVGSPPAWRTYFDGMDSRLLASLIQRGVIVPGGHTVNHPRLACEPQADRIKEIENSKTQLEQITGRPVRLFAYPEGSWNESVARDVRLAGYAGAFIARPDMPQVSGDLQPYCIPRTGINFSGRFYFWWRRIGAGAWLRRRAGRLLQAIDRGAHLGYD